MPGSSKPTQLLKLEGRGHRTKAEMEYREAAEKALQTGETFSELPDVAADKIAHAEFLRLKELYDRITYIDALDTQIINRYCLEVSRISKQQEMMNDVQRDLENNEDVKLRVKLYETLNRMQVTMARSKDMLLKLEDRLFLNPATRIKEVPKTPPDDPLKGKAAHRMSELEKLGFGDV